MKPKYIGGTGVGKAHPFLSEDLETSGIANSWEQRIRLVTPKRADLFRHYTVAMRKVFGQLAEVVTGDGRAIFVVGHSKWNGIEIPSSELLADLAAQWFELKEVFSYPLKNRYMSYKRHNGANIASEFVLVFGRV